MIRVNECVVIGPVKASGCNLIWGIIPARDSRETSTRLTGLWAEIMIWDLRNTKYFPLGSEAFGWYLQRWCCCYCCYCCCCCCYYKLYV